MFHLSNHENFFEMFVAVEEESKLPSFGDARLEVSASSQGFEGKAAAWAHAEEMKNFCLGLVTLNQTLSGEAKLSSMSPNELELIVFASNSRGHLAVEGSMGHHFIAENGSFWHSVSFGFEFEASQLASAVKSPWVQRYVG
ncbi:hypothetical protein ACFONG_19470 [Uliginosibacterium paludis]|uniref:Uncharacterized protein n=1 Tax=Uliginosibacterium paludis TaxID=1615952 RepID=A0ABV2CUD1_9RHOO